MPNVKKQIQDMSDALGENVTFVDMMEDFTATLQQTYNDKIEEYLELVPKNREVLQIMAINCPSALVSVIFNIHKGQREAMGTNDTPAYRMMIDSLELFQLSNEQMDAANQSLKTTQH